MDDDRPADGTCCQIRTCSTLAETFWHSPLWGSVPICGLHMAAVRALNLRQQEPARR